MTFDVQAWLDSNLADAQKEVARYQLRIDNAEAVAREELGKEYEPQIQSLQGEVEALKGQRDQVVAAIEKLAISLSVGIPQEKAAVFGELLQGDNPDDYRAHAERLLDLFKRL